MTDAKLTTADQIDVESVTKTGGLVGSDGKDVTSEVDISRWQNYGKDRLYINDGIAKADKYSLHVDLAANSVETDNDRKHRGDVDVDGDEATVVIEGLSGGDVSATYEIALSVEWGN